MYRLAISAAIVSLLAGAAPVFAQPAPAAADAVVFQVKNRAELKEKFCSANPNIEHVFVLPGSLFVDSQQMICDSGPYKMYRIVEAADTDDFEYFLDPPIYAKGNRLGCDGKAGLTQQTVAINCRPLASPKDK
jgi:hypothetical protein